MNFIWNFSYFIFLVSAVITTAIPVDDINSVAEELPQIANEPSSNIQEAENNESATTTLASIEPPTEDKLDNDAVITGGCVIEGRHYFAGQYLPGAGGPCDACYCLRGEMHCAELRCKKPLPGCRPVLEEGRCCPVRFDCDDEEPAQDIEKTGTLPIGKEPPVLVVQSAVNIHDPSEIDYSKVDDLLANNRVRVQRKNRISPVDIGNFGEKTEAVSAPEPAAEPEPEPKAEPEPEPEPEQSKDDGEVNDKKISSPKKPVDLEGNGDITMAEDNRVNGDNGASPHLDMKHEHESRISQKTSEKLDSSVLSNPEPEPVSEPEPESVPKDKADSKQHDRAESNQQPEPEAEPEPELKQEPKLDSKPESIPKSNLKEKSQTVPETTPDSRILAYLENLKKQRTQEEKEQPAPELVITPAPKKQLDEGVDAVNDEGITTLAPLSLSELLTLEVENSPKSEIPEFSEGNDNDIIIGGDEYEDVYFPSYDVNVGTSLLAGKDEPVGVGEVIPVDLGPQRPNIRPGATQAPVSRPSFFDTFMNLFSGPSEPEPAPEVEDNNEPIHVNRPPLMHPPPFRPPPSFGMRPPPPPPLPPHLFGPPSVNEIGSETIADTAILPPPPPEPVIDEKIDNEEQPFAGLLPQAIHDTSKKEDSTTVPEETEIKAEDAVAKTEKIVEEKPKDDIKFKTKFEVVKASASPTRNDLPIIRRPGFLGSRPERPSIFSSRPTLPISRPPKHPESKFSGIISKPVLENGFSGLRDDAESSPTEKSTPSSRGPTLPPSLPNLQIIPFVAADAVVNKGSALGQEDFRSTPRPLAFSILSQKDDCREGGRVWKNGATVARGDNDPCVICTCQSGKVSCQRLECPDIPAGCEAASKPVPGQCCPKISCDKGVRVSISDTVPELRPLETTPSPPVTIRRKPNLGVIRRPPFVPGGRRPIRPLERRTNPFTFKETTEESTAPPTEAPEAKPRKPFVNRRPAIKPLTRIEEKKTILSRPHVRPAVARPSPFEFRPQFKRNRTAGHERPDFLPIRRPTKFETTRRPFRTTTARTLPPPTFSTTTPTTTTTEKAVEAALPVEEETIFSISNDDSFLPLPGLLLPRPLKPSRPDLDEDIINFVLQDKIPQPHKQPNVVFDRPTSPAPIVTRPTTTFAPLPEIPESIKSQLPLGNDPILTSGLFEIDECNVYGHLYKVDDSIEILSAQCKECRCTRVGVQCLPIC